MGSMAESISSRISYLQWKYCQFNRHDCCFFTSRLAINRDSRLVILDKYYRSGFFRLVLTVVAKKMQRQHMLVKSLQIIETFNAVSVIITDKVGILTQNTMRVTHLLWDKQGIYEVPTTKPIIREGVLQRIGADIVNEVQSQPFRDLLRGAALCNNAEEQIIEDTANRESDMRVVGDVADTALYNLCIDRCFIDITTVRQNNHRLKVVPFHSLNHCMITAHQLPSNHSLVKDENDQILIIMKGTTDPVLACCSSYMTDDNEILPLNDSVRQHLCNRQDELGKTKIL